MATASEQSARPDYRLAREQAGFSWSAAGSQSALRHLAGIPIREFNLDPAACAEAYRCGRPRLRERFGPDVRLPGITTPAVSYGHVNVLGCELLFPEGGEVAHTHLYGSLEAGLAALQRPVDCARAGLAPFYLDFQRRLQAAFPDEPVHLAFGIEGPITTAYELRGEGFFTDLLDRPERARAFLQAAVASVLDYHYAFLCPANGWPRRPSPSGAGLCDDLSSFVPARLWGEIVLPAWDQHLRGLTTGRRQAHVEDLRPAQLPFLEEIGLSFYDPSISPRLHPRLVAEHCRVPFLWRLGSFHYREMGTTDVEDFVFQAVADGANCVATYVEESMCDEATVPKVHAFVRAAREAERWLATGGGRGELGQRVSPAGRAMLWDGWCGFTSPRSTRGGASRPGAATPA